MKRSPIKRSFKPIRKISEKQKEKNLEDKERTRLLHKWFWELFDEKKDKDGYVYCFETGTPMHESMYKLNSCIYSHCYPKSSHPQYAMKEWNVLLVLPNIHHQWEVYPEKCPKMWNYMKKIKEKFGNIE